jgi:hypothetical protein
MSTLGKRVYLTVPRVRIPPSPPIYAFARASLLATIGCAAVLSALSVDLRLRSCLALGYDWLRRNGTGNGWGERLRSCLALGYDWLRRGSSGQNTNRIIAAL